MPAIIKQADRPKVRKRGYDLVTSDGEYIYLGEKLPYELIWLKIEANEIIRLYSIRNAFMQMLPWKLHPSDVQSSPLKDTIFESQLSEFSQSKELSSKLYWVDMLGPFQLSLDKLAHRNFSLYSKLIGLDLARSSRHIAVPEFITDLELWHKHLREEDSNNIPQQQNLPISHQQLQTLFIEEPQTYNSIMRLVELRDRVNSLTAQLHHQTSDYEFYASEDARLKDTFLLMLANSWRLACHKMLLAEVWAQHFPGDASYPLDNARKDFEDARCMLFNIC